MSLQTNYDSWHRKHAGGTEPAPLTLEPWHLTALKLIPDLNGLHVLEIGCGRGDFSRHLIGKYPSAQITAVDFSAAAIDVARIENTKTAGNLVFEVADATSMHYPKETFDYVISCECLEHIPEPGKMAREMERVLKPGGGFVLTTENYFNGMLLAWVQTWLTARPFNSGSGVQPHENFFLYWRVRRLLQQAGLHVTHMESTHFQWLLLPRVSPERLRTKDFRSPFWKAIFRPFGRHFSFVGMKPEFV
jgi:ubiquinone/menaquinone biosynthesis C-methylase UbiE